MPSTEELAPLPPTEYDEGLPPQEEQPPALPQVDAEGNLLATATSTTPKKKRNKKL